jgi:hypothetical protein
MPRQPPPATGGYRPVGQPGGPPATGSTPSTGSVRTGRPAGAPVRPDRTPQNTARPRQQPNRAFEQRTRGSLIVVVVLLVAAFVIGVILWATSRSGAKSPSTPTTTAAGQPGETTPAASADIAALTLYDPDGDGTEQDAKVHLADDANPDTAWVTVCYGDRFLGGKSGLGLVADLGAARSGTISAEIASAPYQVEVLTAPDSIPPSLSSGWTSVGTSADTSAGTVSATVTDARYVAVLFHELGPDTSCSRNRFRGKISEISFQAG